MNLNISLGTGGYNNKILVLDRVFSLGKNEMVNTSEKSSHKTPIMHTLKTSIVLKHAHEEVLSKHTSAISHE